VVRHHLGALALLAAFALPLTASAQTFPNPGSAGPAPSAQQHSRQGPGHHHRRDPYMHAMRGLGLSSAQHQQILGIMKSSRVAMRQQIDGVLTPDQRTQLHAKLAQARHMKPNGPRPQAPAQ
jgi:Spy/CpxP family protein refolding chaperone